jgi:hypothetical protein
LTMNQSLRFHLITKQSPLPSAGCFTSGKQITILLLDDKDNWRLQDDQRIATFLPFYFTKNVLYFRLGRTAIFQALPL